MQYNDQSSNRSSVPFAFFPLLDRREEQLSTGMSRRRLMSYEDRSTMIQCKKTIHVQARRHVNEDKPFLAEITMNYAGTDNQAREKKKKKHIWRVDSAGNFATSLNDEPTIQHVWQ